MGTQENNAVVRRCGDELTTGRNTDPDLIDELIDELLAPDYVNREMGDADLAGFKAILSGGTGGCHGRRRVGNRDAGGQRG